ncbi:Hermansky-Pudlak syndrome 1 protein homolog isoform X2 [Gigantopelta aegis]|uniref:Hermansky-Pudlak syndrome 1 protein homolog isoform X2 n=1 Tax=Gigantopelta aegis TaxID=1735272 RepID=UPI001B88C8B7|nr:Hermansky-Pudlak syndrome 1 protein homolog isoform X2 [Gigantopelta aegis]
MKSVLVVNRINDVLFVDCDNDFAVYVNKQGENCYQQDGGGDNITAEVDELLFIAICGDGTETEEFLHRKLQIFYRLIGFLFGPVTDEIGHSRFKDKTERWNFLRRLLDTWDKLYNEEQSFLVEALERLLVNQLVNEKCITLLEGMMAEMKKLPENLAKHALLLVNCKLLALYSDENASELQPADILYIILLVQDIFPPEVHLEDMLSYSYCQTSHPSGRTSSCIPSTARLVNPRSDPESDLDEETDYHSAQTTPRTTPLRSRTPVYNTDEVDELHRADHSASETSRSSSSILNTAGSSYPDVSAQGDANEAFFTAMPDDSSGRVSADSQSSRSHSSQGTHSNVEISSTSRDNLTSSTLATRTTLKQDYWCQMTFLRTTACPFSPHQLHCTRVLPGVMLVTVVEANRNTAATPLCQVFVIIKDLLSARKDKLSHQQGLHLYDVMNSLLSKVMSALKKVRGDVKRIVSDVRKRWENETFKRSLLHYLEEVAGAELPTGLETALLGLHKKLKELFSYLYLSPQDVNVKVQRVIVSMSEQMSQELGDYRMYLSVKAQRNIPMTSYLNEFPGLIHFMYTDRQLHQLTAPSFNITCEEGRKDATQYLKEKVWRMSELLKHKLSEGYTSVILRDGDYYYSHFLWFEDNVGNPLSVQQPFKPSSDFPPSGILIDSFYRQLIRHCFPNAIQDSVHCYELFMMHIGLVHPQFIAAHCRQLAKNLWEMSGKAFTPISLL